MLQCEKVNCLLKASNTTYVDKQMYTVWSIYTGWVKSFSTLVREDALAPNIPRILLRISCVKVII